MRAQNLQQTAMGRLGLDIGHDPRPRVIDTRLVLDGEAAVDEHAQQSMRGRGADLQIGCGIGDRDGPCVSQRLQQTQRVVDRAEQMSRRLGHHTTFHSLIVMPHHGSFST